MPEGIESVSTKDLLDMRTALSPAYTLAQILEELATERYVEEDDTNEPEQLRGGIRPHRPHI